MVNNLIHEQIKLMGYNIEDAFFTKLMDQISSNASAKEIIENITGLSLNKPQTNLPVKKS